jgi:hypothetical protein
MTEYVAGWYDNGRGQLQYHDGTTWTEHIRQTPEVLTGPDAFAKQLATYEKVSGWLWIGLGIVQVLTLWLAVAGAWNIYAGITRIRSAKVIEARDYRVPQAFSGVTQYVVLGVLNALLGAWIGLLILGLDFWIRSRVLANAEMFDQIYEPHNSNAVTHSQRQPDAWTPDLAVVERTDR